MFFTLSRLSTTLQQRRWHASPHSDFHSAQLGRNPVGWRSPEVPGQAELRHEPDDQVAHVELPPFQAVARRGWEGVVVVVPSFAEPKHTKDHVVPAVIMTLERLGSPDVADGVDAPGR